MIKCVKQKLTNDNIGRINMKNVVCYVFVGGNPGGTEGDVYIFSAENRIYKIYVGNIGYGDLSDAKLEKLFPKVKSFYSHGGYRFDMCDFGWKGIPFVMGHYVFVREFMANQLQKNLSTSNAKTHFERLVQGVFKTCQQYEKRLEEIKSSSNVLSADICDQKIAYQKSTTALYRIVKEYGPVWEQPKKIKALLMDLYPEEKLLRNLLLTCVEERIPHELSRQKSCSEAEVYRFAKIVVESHGCTIEKAKEIIMLWIDALEIGYGKKIELSQEEVLALPIDELNLSMRSYKCLNRAGINVVGDLVLYRSSDLLNIRNFGQKSLEEVLEKLKELGLVLTGDIITIDRSMQPGHKKCEQLRNIRKKIAQANGIIFEPAECDHDGPCMGSCPVCDAEIRYLDRELQRKKDRGEKIAIDGIAADDIKEALIEIPKDRRLPACGGRMEMAPICGGHNRVREK